MKHLKRHDVLYERPEVMLKLMNEPRYALLQQPQRHVFDLLVMSEEEGQKYQHLRQQQQYAFPPTPVGVFNPFHHNNLEERVFSTYFDAEDRRRRREDF